MKFDVRCRSQQNDEEVNTIDPLFTVGSLPPTVHHKNYFTWKIKVQWEVELEFKWKRERNIAFSG